MRFATTVVSLALALGLGALAALPALAGPQASTPGAFMGDFNGDGKQDVAILDSATLGVYVYVTASTIGAGASLDTAESGFLVALPAGATIKGVGDFNGDAHADLLVLDGGGNLVALVSDSAVAAGSPVALDAALTGYLTTPPAGWFVESVADANGDGNADVYVGNADGSVYVYITALTGSVPGVDAGNSGRPVVLPPSWSLGVVGDMNGDGLSDMVARNDTPGATHALYTFISAAGGTSVNGAASGSPGAYPDGYDCCAAGDFTPPAADGSDLAIVGLTTNPGLTYVYALGTDGFTINAGTSAANVALPGGWEPEGLGNFNDDEIADLLASNTGTGQLLVFLSGGPGSVTSVPFLTTMPAGWAVPQFQGMGVAD